MSTKKSGKRTLIDIAYGFLGAGRRCDRVQFDDAAVNLFRIACAFADPTLVMAARYQPS